MFEKVRAVAKEKKRRAKEAATNRRIEYRREEYKSLYTAEMVEKLKRIDFILENANSVTMECEEKDQPLIHNYMAEKELENYQVEENGTRFKLKLRTIDI